jgi:hypothetical protein
MVSPKHLDENRLRELVEFRQGFPALGSKGIGLVEDGGNAALFQEGWDHYLYTLKVFEMPVITSFWQLYCLKVIVKIPQIGFNFWT